MTAIYVNVYVGQTRAAGWIRRLEGYGWGEMVCRGELPARRHPWAYDNGAFKDWKAAQAEAIAMTAAMQALAGDEYEVTTTELKPQARFDEKKFLSDLDWIHLHAKTLPDFVVVPDIVAGGRASLDFSLSWVDRPALRALKAPLYLAVQDGMAPADVIAALPKFAGLFVGGTLEWKLKSAESWVMFAHERGKRCHIGRVGTEKRVRWALRIGADSIDSCLPLWSEENLQAFLRGFKPTATGELFA